MGARFDHLVVAVEDLDEAAARWRAAGIPAERGGAHPVGTENVLVRGPAPAYVELIAAGSEESNPWLDRIRAARGPISWAVAVDDLDEARTTLEAAGFEPDPPVPGSRRTPDGELLEWRVCDVGPGPYDGSLPFLIEWTTPMAPGPADGPVLEWISLVPPDPDRVAALLLALGFTGHRHFPRRAFFERDAVSITLLPLGEPEHAGEAAWVSFGTDSDLQPASIVLATPHGMPATLVLDQVEVTTRPDRRRFPETALLPAVDEAFARLRGDLADWPDPHPGGRPAEEEYSRVTEPERYRLLARAFGRLGRGHRRGRAGRGRAGRSRLRHVGRGPAPVARAAPPSCAGARARNRWWWRCCRTRPSSRSGSATLSRCSTSSPTAAATPATPGRPTCSTPSTTPSSSPWVAASSSSATATAWCSGRSTGGRAAA